MFVSRSFLCCLHLEARSEFKFGQPANPDPLLDVVGQRGPERLALHLEQAARAKAAQSQLFFDPGVGKLSHLRSQLVNLPRPRRFHLLSKSLDIRAFFERSQGAPLAFGTALRFEPATLASCRWRVVKTDGAPADFSLPACFERLSGRTAISV